MDQLDPFSRLECDELLEAVLQIINSCPKGEGKKEAFDRLEEVDIKIQTNIRAILAFKEGNRGEGILEIEEIMKKFDETISEVGDVDGVLKEQLAKIRAKGDEGSDEELEFEAVTRYVNKDPFHKGQIENPLKAKVCNHVFDEKSVLEMLSNKRSFQCPVVGCEESITEESLEEFPQFFELCQDSTWGSESNLAHPAKRVKLSSYNKNTAVTREVLVLPDLAPMNRLKSDQRNKVKNFIQWTQQSETTAITCLQKADWSLDYAVDLFYQNPHWFQSAPTTDKYKLEGLFCNYANDPRDESGPQNIGPNGVVRLLNDLKLDPTDRRVLLLACKLKAKTQCEFSWDEWEQGLSSLSVDSVDKLREKLNQLDAGLTDQTAFRELYTFTFAYGKPAGQRSMDLESSLAYWKILFKDLFPLLDLWEEFLVTEHGKGISKDTWCLLLDFCFNIKSDLTNYDDDGAWPVLIDQFVDYARTKLNLPKTAS